MNNNKIIWLYSKKVFLLIPFFSKLALLNPLIHTSLMMLNPACKLTVAKVNLPSYFIIIIIIIIIISSSSSSSSSSSILMKYIN